MIIPVALIGAQRQNDSEVGKFCLKQVLMSLSPAEVKSKSILSSKNVFVGLT